MTLLKFLTITIIINYLITFSLATQFNQDDILAFPHFKVVLTSEKISNSQTVELSSSLSNNIVMTSSSNQPFSCSIPNVQIEQEINKQEKEENVQNTIEKGLELLEPLELNCIRFFASNNQYWAYEYCHNQHVRQFHIERSHDGKVEKEQETASFYLGLYSGSSSDDNTTFMRKVGDQRYLVQEWKNGSNCDLTDKPRTVEIQYHCDNQGQDRVSSFVEVSTCHYQIIVSTPRLCQEMNLSPRQYAESHLIKCKPIVSDKLIEQQQQEIQKLLEAAAAVEVEKVGIQVKQEEQEENDENVLLDLISDLTQQINQLKVQMNTMPTNDGNQAIFTFSQDIGKLILDAKQQQVIKKEKAKDQHENKQAYSQNYVAE